MTIIEKIMNGSLEVFVEKGFDGSSVSLITKRSKVSNGAIYHHFASKEDIIKKLFIEIKLELSEYITKNLKTEENIKKKIYVIWSSIILWSIKNHTKKKFIDMFISSPYYHEVDKSSLEEGYCMFYQILEDAVSMGYIRSMDPELFYCITQGSSDAYINYLTLNPSKNKGDFLKEAFTSYWRSIADL